MATNQVKVVYWIGTTQHEEWVSTYAEAMKVASKNQNAYDPSFYDSDGRELIDDGNGLRHEDSDAYCM